jgi:hypothetical protein
VQNTAAPSPLNTFVRYRITWLAYGFLAYMTFMPTALGPLMPYMRDELNLSYTLGALHLSVMALGVVISGLTADRLIRFLGGAGCCGWQSPVHWSAPVAWCSLASCT